MGRLRRRTRAYEGATHHALSTHALAWLERFGPKVCLLSWLPVVGDPLCGGWVAALAVWPCVGWMALGKFLRFIVYTAALFVAGSGVLVLA